MSESELLDATTGGAAKGLLGAFVTVGDLRVGVIGDATTLFWENESGDGLCIADRAVSGPCECETLAL